VHRGSQREVDTTSPRLEAALQKGPADPQYRLSCQGGWKAVMSTPLPRQERRAKTSPGLRDNRKSTLLITQQVRTTEGKMIQRRCLPIHTSVQTSIPDLLHPGCAPPARYRPLGKRSISRPGYESKDLPAVLKSFGPPEYQGNPTRHPGFLHRQFRQSCLGALRPVWTTISIRQPSRRHKSCAKSLGDQCGPSPSDGFAPLRASGMPISQRPHPLRPLQLVGQQNTRRNFRNQS
jgi:hypothetical protein